MRLHFPPRLGIRATRPNEVWHIDETVVRLSSGTHLYIQAIVDNFSRFILAWRVSAQHGGPWSLDLLCKAETLLRYSEPPPKLVCDKGGENFNQPVNDHLLSGVLRRILARVDIVSSNSLIERFWMALKHRCLYLHGLTTEHEVTERTTFFVHEHNQVAPQVALRGRTPEEAYFGLALDLPAKLAAARARARAERIDHNRNLSCASCATTGPPTTDTRVGPRDEPAGDEVPSM